MTLHISEAEVREVLNMPLAIEAVEEISRKQASEEVVVHPRRRFELPGGGFFHYMAAADYSRGFIAMKQYTYVHGKLCFLVPLYEMATGDLLALIEADYMGQLRTGAASGVATKYLARKEARVAAIIGTGGQARTQLEAMAAVRKLQSARAYGRDAAKREKFCKEMSERLGIPVSPATSAGEAARGADVVSTATTASQPVLHGGDLTPGVLIIAFHGDEICWTGVKKLSDVVAGKTSGRTSDAEVTLFKSNGIASWDLAVAMKVYALAREKKLGRELPLWTDGSSAR